MHEGDSRREWGRAASTVEEHELANLARLLWGPAAPGEYQWLGFRMGTVREVERRWRDDGLTGEDSSFLSVGLEDGTCAGWVTWRAIGTSGTFEIGIALFPEHRGHGIGIEAQRQLVEYLFSRTAAYRLQAGTEVDNLAEQRARASGLPAGRCAPRAVLPGRPVAGQRHVRAVAR